MYLSVILIVEVVKGVKIIDLRHFKTFYLEFTFDFISWVWNSVGMDIFVSIKILLKLVFANKMDKKN